MTGPEAGVVVDKVAEKLGVAVSKIEPIAQQVLNEVAVWGFARIIIGCLLGCLAVVCALLIVYAVRKVEEESTVLAVCLPCGIIGLVSGAVMGINIGEGIRMYCAPTLYALNQMMGGG